MVTNPVLEDKDSLGTEKFNTIPQERVKPQHGSPYRVGWMFEVSLSAEMGSSGLCGVARGVDNSQPVSTRLHLTEDKA